MEKNSSVGLLFLGVSVAFGLASGGYFVGQTMYNAKVALNTAEAKGLAERRVKADRANWHVKFFNVGKSRAEIPKLYEQTEANQREIIAIIKEAGFADDEIKIDILDYSYQEYRDENQKVVDQEHQLTGGISVETDNVELVDKARSSVNKLIAKGFNIVNRSPAYSFTKLNEIKPDMLKEATKNARIAASEFAENAGVTVGGIRSAQQGSFFVRDAGEDDTGFRVSDTAKIEKDVRVVTTITFYLTD